MDRSCVICGAKLGNRNKTGYCKQHKHLSPAYKERQARYCSNWYKKEGNKEKAGAYRKKWHEDNRERSNLWHKLYQRRRPKKSLTEEKRLKRRATIYRWRQANRDKWKTYTSYFDRNNKKENLQARIAANLRSRLSKALVNGNKSFHFLEMLGCSVEDLKTHLESLWRDEMCWDNYGHGVGKWSIDHIIPLQGEGVDISDPLVQCRLCRYTNLQPMWFEDNSSKGNKIGEEYGNEQVDGTIGEGFWCSGLSDQEEGGADCSIVESES